jgi:methyl-accepting chemotaxis protein
MTRSFAATDRTRTVAPGGYFSYHGLWAPGIRWFRRMRFASKAWIISMVLVVPALALLLGQMLQHNDEAMNDRMKATREHVEIAHSVLQWAHAKEKAGAPTAEAQALALSALAQLRYAETEYFWVNDMQARVVMHPIKPELNGKEGATIKDPNGKALFVAFVDQVRREGKGFVDYQWPKPGSAAPVDKVSYVMGFEPWGWVVGSGIYVGDLQAAARERTLVTLAILVPALLTGLYLFICFYRVMDGGLAETRRHLRALTDGDLTTVPEPWGRDEAAELMLDLRATQQSLVAVVGTVRDASHRILDSSTEIAAGAMDLSARTEQAAANLEETASAMEEIGATVNQATEHVSRATGLASTNAQVAQRGGEVIGQMAATMSEIQASSRRINDIIGVIDGIAFQTNILALNAAVEAARAGEQGRGFAVVAGEVRSLAQRSASAAREIKQLIVTSVEAVDNGTRIATEAGETMVDVVKSAHQIEEVLSQIANGASEQSLGIGQVGEAVQDLDRATQQNAAMVEQTAAGASALKDEASALASQVARFRLP